MAAVKGKVDKYANVAALYAIETGLGAGGYAQINTGISLQDKVAWLINRIEWCPLDVNSTNFNSDGDYVAFGLCTSLDYAPPASPRFSDPALIDYNRIQRCDIGAAATGMWRDITYIKDFSTLPGGGMLVPAVGIYTFVKTVGCTGTGQIAGRLFFSIIELGTEDYWELIQAYRVYT